MKIGRNDPCPCGSGRKYKQCCLHLERTAGPLSTGGERLREAAEAAEWLVDVLPMPVALDDDPAARPAVLMIVADELVLRSEVLRRPSAEAVELASEMAREIEKVVAIYGVRPRRLVVRDAALARALGSLLEADGIVVEEGSMQDLLRAAEALREYLGGSEAGQPFGSAAPTWAGWGLPAEQCAELFRAAARFFRAAPWRHLWDSETLEVTAPSGQLWFAAVMGRGRHTFGLALHSEKADLDSVLSSRAVAPQAPVLSLAFEHGNAVSKEMRKEVSRAGWEVAGPTAYPTLIAVNTRGGGITRRECTDLRASLEAVAAFTDAHGDDLAAGRPVPDFVHAESGAWIRSKHHLKPERALPPAERLTAGGPEGPGALEELDLEAVYEDPDAVLEAEMAVVARYVEALEEGGLGSRTDTMHGDNAELFLEFLVMHQGVPLGAAHEFDVRVFLYDWFPRKVRTSRTQALALRGSLRRFFRYLAAAEGLRLPAAKSVLAAKDVFESRWESFPGGFWWDEKVQQWCALGSLDLHERLMIHDDRLAGDDEWGATMGPGEARLEAELQRRWLRWRDELLRAGIEDRDELWQQLITRQEAWETKRHPGLGGRTPAAAIAAERRATERALDR